MRFEGFEAPMSEGDTSNGSHLPSLLAGLEDPWPTGPDHEALRRSEYALFLYLTFEEESVEEWWPLEDSPFPPRTRDFRRRASRQKSQRTGR